LRGKACIPIKNDVFGVSPLPEKVVIGKEDWLFLADYGAMDDCRNARPFSQQQLDKIQQHLKGIALTLHSSGIEFYVVVVPDKHTIYPEFLPDQVQKLRDTSRLQQLQTYLQGEKSFQFLNLTDTLLASKKYGQLYFKNESHWNDLGTFIGYQKILKMIQRDFHEVQVLNMSECRIEYGEEQDLDLMKLLGESTLYSEPTKRIYPPENNKIERVESVTAIPPAKRFNANYAFRMINPEVGYPNVLVYRDSFFGSMIPFFEKSFAQSTFIWTNNVDLEYAKDQSIQLVLIEIAERHIDLLAD